jgi:tetratricopeptide (TPR) repeat protein
MATDTAAAPPTRRPDPTRHLWQIPVFLLGVAAFLAAWQGWVPLGQADPASAFLKDLAALRAASEKLTPDPGELKALLGQAAAKADSFPEHAPLAHFVLGSGYTRLAELTPAPDEARNHWILARQHFEQVPPDRLADPADPPRLTYRATKARVAAGLPPGVPPAEIDLYRKLLFNAPPGDEPGEANRLIAELSLRLVPPDLKRAKEALAGYLAEAGLSTPPASLARARLTLSEIHLKLGEADQARKWLAQIGPGVPPEVLGPARAQLGRILMTEHNWDEAAKQWEQVRAATGLPAGLKTMAAYQLGVCRLNSRTPDPAAAAKLFEDAAKSDGPDGPAAAVRLAGLYLQSPDPDRHKAAVPLLAGAVKGLSSPSAYANPLVPLNEVQAAFETAVQVLLADAAFDEAVAAAGAYSAVAASGRDRERRAEALAAWGAALQKSGGPAPPKFAAAAEEYAALAEAQPAATAKADLLRRAAALHRQAGNPSAALAALEALVTLDKLPDEAAAPAWAEYADALVATGRPAAEVVRAFNQAMASGGPASTAVRYRLARKFIDSRHPGLVPLGTALFQQIAEASAVAPAEQEAHERALVELAHEHIRSGQYAEAEARLRKQLSIYPAGPESGLGRLLLGVSLLQRSARPRPDAPELAEAPGMREEALKLFKQIVAEVDRRAPAAGGTAPERDAWLRAQASVRVLQAYQQMGKPNDLLVEAAPLLERYRGTVEELIVLSLVYHANKQRNKPENAADTRERMKEVFEKLKQKPGAFPAASGEYSREYWEKVWFAPDPPPRK